VKQVPLADQKSVHAVGEVARDLRHPRAVGPPAPEVLVDGDLYTVICDRETYEQLLANERIA
jgi:hypothetical protein